MQFNKYLFSPINVEANIRAFDLFVFVPLHILIVLFSEIEKKIFYC